MKGTEQVQSTSFMLRRGLNLDRSCGYYPIEAN